MKEVNQLGGYAAKGSEKLKVERGKFDLEAKIVGSLEVKQVTCHYESCKGLHNEGIPPIDVHINKRSGLPRPQYVRPRNDKKCAFTLAEILITLAVIGVVAAISLPALITNITERQNSERQANIAQKVTQAMEQMRAHGLLNTQYATTDAFVDELQKYLKIAKRCSSSNIADCWPTSTVTGNDEKIYNVSETTTRDKLHFKKIEGNNNVGLVLADGASLILTYNPTTSALDVGDRIEASKVDLPVGGGKTKEFPYTTSVTGSIDFVMDVNGKKGPNKETTANKVGDIRSFKAARFGDDCPSYVVTKGTKIKGICVVNLGTNYSPVDCRTSNSSSENYQYCKPTPSGNNSDKWAGAKKACEDIGLTLANISDLDKIYSLKRKGVEGLPSTWCFSSIENDATTAKSKEFSAGGYGNISKTSGSINALCVGN